MAFTLFRGDASVNALADRLFADLTAESRAKVKAALLKANPQLRDLSRVKDGAVLKVPRIPGIRRKPRTQDDPPDPAAALEADTTETLKAYAKYLDERYEQYEGEFKQQRDVLTKLKRTGRGSGDLDEKIEEIRKNLNIEAKAAKEDRKAIKDSVKALIKGM